jgi:hypothetical protein
MSTQWNARFAGTPRLISDKNKRRQASRITVFALSRDEAVDEVKRQAGLHGYDDVIIEHITKN